MKSIYYLFISIIIISKINFTYAQGSGSTLSFDGLDDYVEIPNNAVFNDFTTSGVMTIEAWVKVNATNTDGHSQTRQPIVCKGFPGEWQWALYIYDDLKIGSSYWQCSGSSHNEADTSANAITIGEWAHVASVYDRNTGYNRIYVNGVLAGERTVFSSTPCNGTRPVWIGGREDGQYLDASIDEVRIWNEAKTETQLRDNMCKKLLGTETNLAAYYRMDSASGTTVSDSSSNSLNGTMHNMNTTTDWEISGAALGDSSSYNYPANWAGQTINLTSTNKGDFEVNTVSGTPKGIHIYRVDQTPNSIEGITNTIASNDVYYGVFVVDAGSNYITKYTYSNYPEAVSTGLKLDLFKRAGNTINDWTSAEASINNGLQTYTKNTNTGVNQEYLLGRYISGYKGPGGVGNPNGSSDLVLWLNADNIGNSNTFFADQSGYGFDFNSGVGATLNSNDTNGYNSYSFDGSSNYFQHPFETILNPKNISIFSTSNVSPSGSYKAVYSSRTSSDANGRTGFILYSRPTSNNWHFWNGNGLGWDTLGNITSTENTWSSQSCFFQNKTNGKKLYSNNQLDSQDTHNYVNNLTGNFRVGAGRNENTTPQYYFLGKISEIIMFNSITNDAQKTIINNYLSAKYNFSLSNNDFYTQDDTANGNYDHNVAGIGQATNGSRHVDAQGTGIIHINSPSTLSNDTYLFWGEKTKNPTYDFATINATTVRLNSKWHVSKRNDLGTVSVSFNEAAIITNTLKCGKMNFVVANNDTFSGATTYPLTLNAGVYTATNVNFTDGDYFTLEYKENPTTTWNGATWDNNAPDIETKSVLSQNYDMNSLPNITTCTCELAAGKTIIIPSGKHLEVAYEITNNGAITVDHGGAIVQNDNTNNNIGTNYTIKKTANQTAVTDVTYFSTPTVGTTIDDMVPSTTYKYDFNASVQNWNYGLTGASVMTVARGYILRNPTVGGDYTVTFTGEIYNGTYNAPVVTTNVYGGDDDWNLLGNPYPSAIDADELFNTNSSIIKGAVYYWKHLTVLNGAGDDYVDAGYTVYNGLGGTATVGGTIGDITATQYIPSGVGFFVEATNSGDVVFSNAHRVTDNNNTVFRIADNSKRIWLNLIENNTGKGRQQLIGFINEATDGVDNLYDAHALGNGLTFYSLLENEKYSIQATDQNYEGEIIPLGYQCTHDGQYTITIDHTTGTIADAGNYIYLRDNELNIVHNLTEDDYTFTSILGEFNERFELFATQTALAVEETIANTDSLIILQNQDTFSLRTIENQEIEQVTIYDIVGRKLLQVNINEFSLTLNKGTVLILNVTLQNGIKLSKKVIKM
jgi:hypothetical protein